MYVRKVGYVLSVCDEDKLGLSTEALKVAKSTNGRQIDLVGFTHYQIVTFADATDVCRQHDGKVYRVAEAREGVNLPPFHPNCRCVVLVSNGDPNRNPQAAERVLWENIASERLTDAEIAMVLEKLYGDFSNDERRAFAAQLADLFRYSPEIVRQIEAFGAGRFSAPSDIDLPVFSIPRTDQDRLTDEQQIANAEYIFEYLRNEGWSVQAISALLGNIHRESWLNPGVWQQQDRTTIVNNDRRAGFGLLQWTPAIDFFDWAGIPDAQTANSMDPLELMNLQLEFIVSSMQPESRRWLNDRNRAVDWYHAPFAMTFEEFMTSTEDVETLTLILHGHYLRSGDTAQMVTRRVEFAENWYEHFSGR